MPVEHQLIFEHADPDLNRNISEAAYGQSFVGRSSLAFLWTSIPYRMEWRYHTAAHKVIAIDAGHVCQNLYLAVEAEFTFTLIIFTCFMILYLISPLKNQILIIVKSDIHIFFSSGRKINPAR